MGGEKFFKTIIFGCSLGSPPRGRGKVDTDCILNRTERITPAWAGKSCFGEVCVDGLEDHPRVGGEKMRASPRRTYLLGSPPRGRGKGLQSWLIRKLTRITPAWAGKSGRAAFDGVGWWDHPRVGGEKQHFWAKSVEK